MKNAGSLRTMTTTTATIIIVIINFLQMISGITECLVTFPSLYPGVQNKRILTPKPNFFVLCQNAFTHRKNKPANTADSGKPVRSHDVKNSIK